MTRPARALLALSLTCLATIGSGCVAAPPQKPSQPGPTADSKLGREMLTAHNEVRAKAKPKPRTPLLPLTWSDAMAAKAQAWANQCQYKHNPGLGPYGENIAAAAPPGSTTNPGVVQSWAAEVADYSYAKNSCAPGKVCGHYTQLVWADTKQVGCAKVLCTKNSPFGANAPEWEFWVCDYAPPGNYVGEKPY